MSSILKDIRTLVVGDPESIEFDPELMIYINAALARLARLGIGQKGFVLNNDIINWSEFMDDPDRFEDVKQYVYMKVKMVFDPPTSSAVLASYEKMIQEAEWELCSEAEVGDEIE